MLSAESLEPNARHCMASALGGYAYIEIKLQKKIKQ